MALRWTDGKNWDFAKLAGEGSEVEIIDFLDAFGLDRMPYDRPAFKDRQIYRCLFLSEQSNKEERYQFLKGLGLRPLSLENKGELNALVQNLGENPDDEKREGFKRLLEKLLEDNPELGEGKKKAAVDLGYRWTFTFLKAFATDLDYVRFFYGIGIKFDPSHAWSWILGEDQVDLVRLLYDLGCEFPDSELDVSARYPGWDVQSAEMLAFLAEKGIKIISVAGGRPKEALIEAAKLGAAPKESVFETMNEDVYRAFLEAGFPAKDIDIELVRSAGRDDLLQLLADYGVSVSDYTPDLLKSINATWKETDPILLESALAGEAEVDWPKVVEVLANRYFSRRYVGEVDPIAEKIPWAEIFRQALSKAGEGLSFEVTYKTGWRCALPEDAEVVQLLCSKGAHIEVEGGDPRLVLFYCDNDTTDAILGALGVNREDLNFSEMGVGKDAKGVSDYLLDADNLDAYDWLSQKDPGLIPSASDAVKKSLSAAEAHRWHTWEWLVLKKILGSIADGSMKDGRSAAANAYGLVCKGDNEIVELYGKKLQMSDAQRRKLEADVVKKLEKDRSRCWSAEQKEEMNERVVRLRTLIDAANAQSQLTPTDSASQKKASSKKMSITEAVRLAQEGIERRDGDALSVLAPFKGKVKEKNAVDLAMRIAAFGGSGQVEELFRLAEAGWDYSPALCVAIRNGNDSAAEGLIACGATLSLPRGKASKKQQEDPARYCRNAIYARCYQEIEQFFDYVLPEEHPAGKREKWKATAPGEEIDEAAARALLTRLHEKRLINKLDARRFAITIFRAEGNGSDLFPLAKSLYEYSDGKAVDAQLELVEYCRVEDLAGREFASDELDEYAFSVGDAKRLRKRFEEGKSTIVQRPRSLRKFIPILTGEEIGTKTNLMKALAKNGYLEELKMVEAWDGAFTEDNIDEALAAAMEAGQVETQSYLVEKRRELFGDSRSLEI